MDSKQQLFETILNRIYSFEGSFTLEKLFEVLRKEKIMYNKNKEQVVDIVNKLFETCIIENIPFSDLYRVV